MTLFETVITPQAIELATAVLRSEWVSEGSRVSDFERALNRDFKLANPVAVNSGTAALHLGLLMAGVQSGDEVILPAQTFVATGHAVLMQSAKPVFADIDPLTGNMCPDALRAASSHRTKAIIAVHWGGYPCDMDEITSVARSIGVPVVEDAAQAFGASYRDRVIGTISSFTCFSFQAIKHVTCGDGGALCCRNEEDAHRARRTRWFGIDRTAKPSELGERDDDIFEIGFKYHMNDLSAAVGLGNLQGFGTRLSRRKAISNWYRKALSGIDGITMLRSEPDRESAAWLFTLRVRRRADFIRALASRNIPSSVVHRRIDRFTIFGGSRDKLEGQRLFDEEQVSIPLHSRLTDEDVQRVIDAIRTGW